jgi:hypothetical protein
VIIVFYALYIYEYLGSIKTIHKKKNISWPTTAIKNPRNTVHSSFCGFFDTYSQRKTYEVPTRYRADTGEDTVKSTQKFLIFE